MQQYCSRCAGIELCLIKNVLDLQYGACSSWKGMSESYRCSYCFQNHRAIAFLSHTSTISNSAHRVHNTYVLLFIVIPWPCTSLTLPIVPCYCQRCPSYPPFPIPPSRPSPIISPHVSIFPSTFGPSSFHPPSINCTLGCPPLCGGACCHC